MLLVEPYIALKKGSFVVGSIVMAVVAAAYLSDKYLEQVWIGLAAAGGILLLILIIAMVRSRRKHLEYEAMLKREREETALSCRRF